MLCFWMGDRMPGCNKLLYLLWQDKVADEIITTVGVPRGMQRPAHKIGNSTEDLSRLMIYDSC